LSRPGFAVVSWRNKSYIAAHSRFFAPCGVLAMKRLWLLLLLFLLAGCASEGSKGQWDEFWKDLRGDNMKMRNDVSIMK
jgi:hypothetical protein